jgi:hypothetical protein
MTLQMNEWRSLDRCLSHGDRALGTSHVLSSAGCSIEWEAGVWLRPGISPLAWEHVMVVDPIRTTSPHYRLNPASLLFALNGIGLSGCFVHWVFQRRTSESSHSLLIGDVR